MREVERLRVSKEKELQGPREMARVLVELVLAHARSQDLTDRISSQLCGKNSHTVENGICFKARLSSSS